MRRLNFVEATYAEIIQMKLRQNPYYCLMSANIDINPHQIEAYVFALTSLKNGGTILADEVGLGKTIEAGLIIKHYLLSGQKDILLIMPSSLRKQWQIELDEKFGIESKVLDSSNFEDYKLSSKKKNNVVMVSYNFASQKKDYLATIAWDLCVFDEAHRMRNVYKNGNKMASAIYELTKKIPKIMLTATPMQNSLLDLYGLIQFVDDRIFYDKSVFSERYIRNEMYEDLKTQLSSVVQRTLRSEVADYIQFPRRKEMTVDFELSPKEVELYMLINKYLKKEVVYALPNSHRTLITSVIRKLLASSSIAVGETFRVLKNRLIILKETTRQESADESIDFFFDFIEDEDIDIDSEVDYHADELYTRDKVNAFIQHEISEVETIINCAEGITYNAKMAALKQAVARAFEYQTESNVSQKIVVFTESVRTQGYIFEELEKNGYKDQVLLFNGSSNDEVTKNVYKAWKARSYGCIVGSRNIEIKNAIVNAFRDDYKILLVTDSGSEGLNLQFCSTVINYDLPWNPQKIEQRIGRCHRYGQKNDVVVINLLNTQNVADQKVYEILSQKFELFQGVFGASDKAIGLLESGADFEKRVTQIYQECDTVSDFTKKFATLEKELERKSNKKMEELTGIITKKPATEHKEDFNWILSDINLYKESYEYWLAINTDRGDVRFPVYYEAKEAIEGIDVQHGYILVGGYYQEDKLITPVFQVIDSTDNFRDCSDQQIRNILNNLSKQTLCERKPDNAALSKILIKMEERVHKLYLAENTGVINLHKNKLENWLALRKEEYILKTRDVSDIQELQEIYSVEKDFKKKIELKRKIENLQKVKQTMQEQFHDSMSELELEAARQQEEFEQELLNQPQLFIKIIIGL